MCGRYFILPDPASWNEVREEFGDAVADQIAQTKPRYNVAPSQQIIFIRNLDEGITSDEAVWTFIPHWWKEQSPPKFQTKNARAEDAACKPMWRHAYRHNRCLIPLSGWYEWTGKAGSKQPWLFRDPGGQGMLVAGLWSVWQQTKDTSPILSCAILTREALPALYEIHDRMPVVLERNAWKRWLDPTLTDADEITRLWQENTKQAIEVYPVSKAVNSSRNDGPNLIERVDLKSKPF